MSNNIGSKKQFLWGVVCGVVILLLSLPLFSFKLEEIGNLHTNNYTEIITLGNLAYCQSNISGIDVLDISDPQNVKIVGNIDIASVIHYRDGMFFSADLEGGFKIWELTDPLNPALVGQCELPKQKIDEITSIYVDDGYAYVTAELTGLFIIDIHVPASPVHVGTLTYEYPCEDRWCEDYTILTTNVCVKDKIAYMADYELGFKIADVSKPNSPVFIGEFESIHGTREMYVRDDYVYILTLGGEFFIVDISDPSAPFVAGKYIVGSILGYDFVIQDNYAYIAGFSSGVHIVDISDPANPHAVSIYKDIGRFIQIDIQGNYVYASNAIDTDLFILDISDPASPVKAGTFDLMDSISGIHVRGDYAYIADRHSSLQVVNISNPEKPKLVATMFSNKRFQSVEINGNYAYVLSSASVNEPSGLHIIDISNPLAPKETGYSDTLGSAGQLVYKDGYVYVADGNKGYILSIFDVTDTSSPFIAGSYPSEYSEKSSIYDIDLKGNYAYVAQSELGMFIFDISQPTVPVLVGKIFTKDDKITGIAISGDYAYLLAENIGIIVVNISDPANPVLEHKMDLPQVYLGSFFIYENYIFVAANNNGILVIDINNPISPTLVYQYKYEEEYLWGKDLFVTENKLYLADYYGFYCFEWDATPPQPVKLTIASSPLTDLPVSVTPDDDEGNSDGNTPFTLNYQVGDAVNLTAPLSYQGLNFSKWLIGDQENPNQTINITLEKDIVATAIYTGIPVLEVNRGLINFASDTAGNISPGEELLITNSGTGSMNWTISSDTSWLSCTPDTGLDNGAVTISVNTGGMLPGSYSGTLKVTSPQAPDTIPEIAVTLNVYRAGETGVPFGHFATPINGSTVASSIPVTGWVLDDMGIVGVKIYRQEQSGLAFIGDAMLVEGARPDVEVYYTGYPGNSRAGWGYMLLTNFLPGNGNGTFEIVAIATDIEGNQQVLGSKTIYCDNLHAIKPFGAIDTPAQGGTASGLGYINFGWVLTPQPNIIPIDGSTIYVWVDGVKIGNVSYNHYRSDIATLFPGYLNSQGAVGHYFLDTSKYENGVHTIQWTATDNAGNSDGIGSRYFTVHNTGVSGVQHAATSTSIQLKPDDHSIDDSIYTDKHSVRPEKIRIKELQRISLPLLSPLLSDPNSKVTAGYLIVNDEHRALPIGSTLNKQSGTFHWQPGAGFLGEYHFLFLLKDSNGKTNRYMPVITIEPAEINQ